MERVSRSEIWLVCDRDVVIEQVLVVFGADFLAQRLLHAPVTLRGRPRLIESVRILHREIHFQHLAVIDHPPALNDVQLFGMGGTIIVEEGPVVHSDRIDHQRIALVVSDRLAVPGRPWIFRMGHVEIDAPDLLIALKDDLTVNEYIVVPPRVLFLLLNVIGACRVGSCLAG